LTLVLSFPLPDLKQEIGDRKGEAKCVVQGLFSIFEEHREAALPHSYCPEDRSHIERAWKAGNGDYRQEIVLMGREMDKEDLISLLDDCLLTENELSSDESTWSMRYTDPFPELQARADAIDS
tara:strand:- start:620 stop:988 length:369 start_codon:yes stop_codon:yes gene_type:complete